MMIRVQRTPRDYDGHKALEIFPPEGETTKPSYFFRRLANNRFYGYGYDDVIGLGDGEHVLEIPKPVPIADRASTPAVSLGVHPIERDIRGREYIVAKLSFASFREAFEVPATDATPADEGACPMVVAGLRPDQRSWLEFSIGGPWAHSPCEPDDAERNCVAIRGDGQRLPVTAGAAYVRALERIVGDDSLPEEARERASRSSVTVLVYLDTASQPAPTAIIRADEPHAIPTPKLMNRPRATPNDPQRWAKDLRSSLRNHVPQFVNLGWLSRPTPLLPIPLTSRGLCPDNRRTLADYVARVGQPITVLRAISPHETSCTNLGRALSDQQIAFVYEGTEVHLNEKRLIDLTAMWKAAGSPENRDPRQWRRKEGKGFVADLAKSLNVPVGHIIIGQRGKGGATHGHWQIALAYAKHLSNEFHRYVNEAFRDWAQEKADPELKLTRAIEGYRRGGKSDEWIEKRFKSVGTRKALTSAMKRHNCVVRGDDNPYREATRAIALRITGQTPTAYREAKGISKSSTTRDAYDERELISIEWAESQARLLIERRGAEGNQDCVQAARDAARAIRLAMDALEAA